MKEQITIHTMTTHTGALIKYARIFCMDGQTVVGQSILLQRLSPAQLRLAVDVSHNGYKKKAHHESK